MSRNIAAVRGSASWAAWADALGFITELVDRDGLRYRVGRDLVTDTVNWRRRVGGRAGVIIDLPAGSYSDDTQLRLASARAIRGDGSFDVEAFAKVEITSWQNYALGAGRGSKAAAASLSRADTTWVSNFFETKQSSYVNGGGNGAAMRIQPHVWAHKPTSELSSLVRNIVRDSICTHGHPVGILGAVIHGLSLNLALETSAPPSFDYLPDIIEEARSVEKVIRDDEELSTIWVPSWDSTARRSFFTELRTTIDEALTMSSTIRGIATGSKAADEKYSDAVKLLGGFEPATRGSGVITAILANYACTLSALPEEIIRIIANTLGSDTDTIGTMAGAIIGACVRLPAPGQVQDSPLIDAEAKRLFKISRGELTTSHRYPDLLAWNVPRSPLDLIATNHADQLVLAGHGELRNLSEPKVTGRDGKAIFYRWAESSGGQHFLIRHREEPNKLPHHKVAQLAPSGAGSEEFRKSNVRSSNVETADGSRPIRKVQEQLPEKDRSPERTQPVQRIVEEIEDVGFDPATIGRAFLRIADSSGDWRTERAIAFAALLTEAATKRSLDEPLRRIQAKKPGNLH